MSDKFLSLFTELLAVPSPCGREEKLAQIVRDKLTAMGYEPQTDPIGNVLVRLDGSKPNAPLMVMAAHMDEIGMVVTDIESDGSLRVARSGALWPDKIGEGPVEIVGDGDETVIGVLAFGSGHTGSGELRQISWADTRVITGLSPTQLQEAGVRVGSTAVPPGWRRGPFTFGDPCDPMIGAWTFDDRAGVAMLLMMLDRLKQENLKPVHPIIVAFTVQEEHGCHGAKVLAHRERPEIFVAIDGAARPAGSPLTMDGRPAAWSMDTRAHSDQRLVRQLAVAAKEAGTQLQTTVFAAAWSDASMVLEAGGAARIVTFGHVRDSSHGFEVARLSSFSNTCETMMRFVSQDAS